MSEGGSNRVRAARKLTELLEVHSSFSFLRLGDGEIRYLLEVQAQQWKDDVYDAERRSSCEIATGTLGLRQIDFQRLLVSYEACDGLDLYLAQEYNRKVIQRLRWSRQANKWTVADPVASGLINEWTRSEFKPYVGRHRSLVCGAEAGLFKELMAESEYRQIAVDYLPEPGQLEYYEPPERGRNPSVNLNQIKQDLKHLVEIRGCDTLFICLGGAAKILCYELAREMQIRAIDWGSMLRALTYSGADGHSAWRASHNPFFFRVPFPLYLKAMQRAWPGMSREELLGKAHAQLCLEMQRKLVGVTFPADVHSPDTFDRNPENERCFLNAYRYYCRAVRPLAETTQEKALVQEMEHWRLKKGIGVKGKVFQGLVNLKGLARRAFQKRSIKACL